MQTPDGRKKEERGKQKNKKTEKRAGSNFLGKALHLQAYAGAKFCTLRKHSYAFLEKFHMHRLKMSSGDHVYLLTKREILFFFFLI